MVNEVERGKMLIITLLLLAAILVTVMVIGIFRFQKLQIACEQKLRGESIYASSIAYSLLSGFEELMIANSPYVYRRSTFTTRVGVEKYGKWPWEKRCIILFEIRIVDAEDYEEVEERFSDYLNGYMIHGKGQKFFTRVHYMSSGSK